jgi:hypothetical protein
MLRRAVIKLGEGKTNRDDGRIFVKDGLRSFRKTFRVAEVYWGLLTGGVLLGVVGWVTWKGAHPDPSLFDMSAALEGGKGSAGADGAAPPEAGTRRAGSRLGAPRTEPPAAAAASDPYRGAAPNGGAPEGSTAEGSAPPGPGDRGPLPRNLAAGDFREGKIGAYTADTMYVKIDGRAGYFQAFGVKTLHTLTLDGPSETGPTSVDIEVYDLAESRNAIGAYNGERSPSAESISADGSTYHFDRNAAFLARGPYYVRFIGSDESAKVVAEVRRLLDVFRREIAGEALPWGFSLFVDQLKLSPSAVTYVRSNAFSFGFARDVFKASLSAADSKEDMEAFVVALPDPTAAQAMAAQYTDGFASLGKAGGQTPKGVKLVEDEFLATFSGATAVDRFTIGVRGVPSKARAAQEIERLRAAVAAMPDELRARAVPSTPGDASGGEYPAGAAPEPAAAPGSAAAPPPAGEEERAGAVRGESAASAGAEAARAAGVETPRPGAAPVRQTGQQPDKPAEESSDEY